MHVDVTLVLKSRPHALYHRAPDVSAWVDQVEVLPSRLADNPRVALVVIDISSNILPQLLENEGRSGEM